MAWSNTENQIFPEQATAMDKCHHWVSNPGFVDTGERANHCPKPGQ